MALLLHTCTPVLCWFIPVGWQPLNLVELGRWREGGCMGNGGLVCSAKTSPAAPAEAHTRGQHIHLLLMLMPQLLMQGCGPSKLLALSFCCPLHVSEAGGGVASRQALCSAHRGRGVSFKRGYISSGLGTTTLLLMPCRSRHACSATFCPPLPAWLLYCRVPLPAGPPALVNAAFPCCVLLLACLLLCCACCLTLRTLQADQTRTLSVPSCCLSPSPSAGIVTHPAVRFAQRPPPLKSFLCSPPCQITPSLSLQLLSPAPACATQCLST